MNKSDLGFTDCYRCPFLVEQDLDNIWNSGQKVEFPIHQTTGYFVTCSQDLSLHYYKVQAAIMLFVQEWLPSCHYLPSQTCKVVLLTVLLANSSITDKDLYSSARTIL